MDDELVGLSLAPVYRQYLPRRAPSIMSSVDDPNPARRELEPGERMGGSAGGWCRTEYPFHESYCELLWA